MQFQMLGGLRVTVGEQALDLGAPKQRAVVAILLLERDQVVSADRLIELLWGDDAEKALVSLRAYVSRLRGVLEPARLPRDPARVLVSQSPGYRLVVSRADVDLHRMEDEIAEGRRLLRAGDLLAAVESLDGALRGWTGSLLPELADEPFVVAAAVRAEETRLSAVEGAGEAWLALGDSREAIERLEREADARPERERLQALLALALYRSNRQADALRVVDRCRRALVERHGLEPGADLRRLESDLLAQAPSLDLLPAAAPAAASAVPAAVVPAAVAPVTDGSLAVAAPPEAVLVGRAHEQRVLDGAMAEARAGRGGVAVLVGEPGIGKTRLAESVVAAARAQGFDTAWARCPESRATPPFWALTQVAAQLRAQVPASTFQRLDVPGAGGDASSGDPGREGFGLSRTILEQFAVAPRPVLVVVDDLQWADPDSLRLLEYLAADLAGTRVLVVATTRPLADDVPDAFVDCLAEIARIPTCHQLELGGLRLDDVTAWLHGREDVAVPDEVAAMVHERTGGNPLFIKELTELLAAEGRLDDVAAVHDARSIPPGVRFVVRRRVSRLAAPTQHLLSTAAVVGSPFSVQTLSAVAERNVTDVLVDLGPALDEGLLVEVQGDLAFSHALVADALASEINSVRAAAIHAAAARSLAAAAPPGFGTAAPMVAHHALAGMLAGTGELAIDASRRAAELAGGRLAYEDAAAHWEGTATALARVRPGDPAAWIDALIAQAEALTRADRTEAAKRPILEAIDVAGAVGLVDEMVRAASLVNHVHTWTNEAYGVVDPRLVDALERTLAAAEEDDTAARAVLLGALAAELVFASKDRHLDVCADAERVARASGDPVVLARVLNNLMLPNRPGQLDERRANADEMVAIAEAHGLPAPLVYAAHHHVAEAHLEVGELLQAADAMAAAERALDDLPRSHLHGLHLWVNAAIAVTAGRYDEAQEFVHRAHESHRRGRFYDVDSLFLAGVSAIALDHGGLEDLIPFAVATAGTTAYGRAVNEPMAFAMLEVGRADVAESLCAPFGPEAGFADDYTTLAAATAALHVRVELDHPEGATAAAQLLESYEDRWASAGTSPMSMGPVRLALARHRSSQGAIGAAATLFEDSVAMTEANGAVGWLARSLVHHSEFLDQVGDGAGASDARDRAAGLARRYGLPYIARRLAAATTH